MTVSIWNAFTRTTYFVVVRSADTLKLILGGNCRHVDATFRPCERTYTSCEVMRQLHLESKPLQICNSRWCTTKKSMMRSLAFVRPMSSTKTNYNFVQSAHVAAASLTPPRTIINFNFRRKLCTLCKEFVSCRGPGALGEMKQTRRCCIMWVMSRVKRSMPQAPHRCLLIRKEICQVIMCTQSWWLISDSVGELNRTNSHTPCHHNSWRMHGAGKSNVFVVMRLAVRPMLSRNFSHRANGLILVFDI